MRSQKKLGRENIYTPAPLPSPHDNYQNNNKSLKGLCAQSRASNCGNLAVPGLPVVVISAENGDFCECLIMSTRYQNLSSIRQIDQKFGVFTKTAFKGSALRPLEVMKLFFDPISVLQQVW